MMLIDLRWRTGLGPREAVTDKGYHSNGPLQALAEAEVRSYVSEPDRGQRCWQDKPEAKQVVYSNRRRIRGEHCEGLLRRRGGLLERSFAHAYETKRRTQPVAGDAATARKRDTARSAGPLDRGFADVVAALDRGSGPHRTGKPMGPDAHALNAVCIEFFIPFAAE
jgi:hypothetical protein